MQRPDDTEPKDFDSASPEPAQDSAQGSTVNPQATESHADAEDTQPTTSQAPGNPVDSEDSSVSASDSPHEQAEPDTGSANVADESVDTGGDPQEVLNEDTELDPASQEAVAEESLEEQLAERTEDLQRLSAEYANYRRRTERERALIKETAENGVVVKLLPILDDLDLAQQHGDMEGPLKALADKLNTVMRELNVSAFGVPGDHFNPELHEAVQDASTGDEKALGVVLRKGYQAGERVLRTAMVIVADPTQETEAEQP